MPYVVTPTSSGQGDVRRLVLSGQGMRDSSGDGVGCGTPVGDGLPPLVGVGLGLGVVEGAGVVDVLLDGVGVGVVLGAAGPE